MHVFTHPRGRQRLLLGYTGLICAAAAVMVCIWPSQRWGILGMLAAGLAAGWLMAEIGTRSLRRQIHQIRETAEAIRHGAQDRQLDSDPPNDFAKLADTMRHLTEQLQQVVQEHEQLQQQSMRREKLAVIGELAAIVAHEVNNPLDGLQNCTRIIRKNPEKTEQTRQLLDLMDDGLYRIEMIVRRLLSMARDEAAQLSPTRVDGIIADAVMFVRPRLERHGIRLVEDVPETPMLAMADRAQMGQVLINLLINAADSMQRGGVATISVSPASDGRQLRISVADTGLGIDEQHQARIFEPFYTTKGRGHGTGLGLAIVDRIVKAHGGRVEVSSRVGEGTCFHIDLPMAQPAGEPLPAASAELTTA